MLLRVVNHYGEDILFLFLFSCVHPWCLAMLDIMLVQRPDVIGIFWILIYFLYKKKQGIERLFMYEEEHSGSIIIQLLIDTFDREMHLYMHAPTVRPSS